MTKALFRDSLRAMRRTLSRFISIVVIVGLGVGFFTGLRAVSPGMQAAAADFYEQLNLADIVIQSTVGFDENDVAAVLAVPGVEQVTLSRSIDGILFDPPNEYSPVPVMAQGMTGTAYVVRIMGHDFSLHRLNRLYLVAGRFPVAHNEAVVSVYANRMDPQRYAIGQNILIRGDHEDLLDTVEYEIYNIVGVVYGTDFISMELGPSQAGGGELSGYIYIPNSAFRIEHYTTLLVGIENDYAPYTVEYNNLVREVWEAIEAVASDVVRQRVDRLQDYFQPQIEAGRIELAEAIEYGEARLAEAREQLAELDAAVEEGPERLEREREDAERQLAAAQRQFDNGHAEFERNRLEFNRRAAEYERYAEEVAANVPANAREEFQRASDMLEVAQNSFEMGQMAHQAGVSALRVGRLALNSGDPERMENALALLGNFVPLPPAEEGEGVIATLERMIDEAEEDLAEQEIGMREAEQQIAENRRLLEEARADIARLEEFDRAYHDLQAARRQLVAAEAQLENAPAELEAARNRIDTELAQAEEQLARAMETHEWEHIRFANAVQEFEREVANGERRIRLAENQLAALPYAQWIFNNRDFFPGYTNFGDTAENMQQFALIFPVLFFLVAALVSLTTMTRMVEDERTQMGTLKAEGYSARAISFKYLFYALSAGVVGTILGTAMGFLLIPQAIFRAYQILYLIPYMRPGFFTDTAIIGLVAAMVSTVGAVSFSVVRALRHRPAELMRPKAPKAGKRVFLEYLPFIWRRLGFNGKVTVRNLMRNKKRFVMTFLGIMGCTALLLTGFGIGNSIGTMLDRQFGPDSIMRFDGQALLQQNMRAGDEEVLDVFRQHEEIDNFLPALLQRMFAGTEEFGRQIDVTVAVPENMDNIPDFINLIDWRTREPLEVTDDGAFINGKTAELMNLSVGDYITIQNGPQTARVRVAGITYNYIYHWIYMTPQVFEEAFGVEETTFNVVLLKLNSSLHLTSGDFAERMEQRTDLARALSDTAEVITVVYNQTIIDSVGGMLNVMRNVVLVVFTAASGALAFVVLYNLNNINIYERVRELATIKVLGFYDKEADMFIYRENIIISILGIAVGLAVGIPIFGFIIRAAEIESMMFVRDLVLSSYIAAAVITAVFAIGINLLMHKRIKDINMVEALKSVE